MTRFPASMTQRHPPRMYEINCRDRTLRIGPSSPDGVVVMGILNVTPDSFADGGRYLRPENALRRVDEMVDQGATMVDVGGESSRPRGKTYGQGARPITAEEEIRRVVPIIERIADSFPELIISVDTYKPDVAEAALTAGAHIVNDITGGRYTEETAKVAARAGAALIVMHSVGTPGALPQETQHDDVIATVRTSLQASLAVATAAGARDVIVDPGFGFGKSVGDNLRLIRELDKLADLQRPILIGISRKSTIGLVLAVDGQPADVEKRLYGTLGATAVAVMNGASIVRTHDIRPTVDLLRVVAEIANS